jgi:hypothetical protein
MSRLHPESIEHQRKGDSDLRRALGHVLQQIHTIPDAPREDAPGLDLLLLNVDEGTPVLSDHVVAPQMTEGAQGGVLGGTGNTLNLQLLPFVVEGVEALVKEAFHLLQPLTGVGVGAGAGVRVGVPPIIHDPSIVSLRLRPSRTSTSLFLRPACLTQQQCCLREIQIPIASELSLMASMLT